MIRSRWYSRPWARSAPPQSASSAQSSCASRLTAGAAGFLTLIQASEFAPVHCPVPPVLPNRRIAHLWYGRRSAALRDLQSSLCRRWVHSRRFHQRKRPVHAREYLHDRDWLSSRWNRPRPRNLARQNAQKLRSQRRPDLERQYAPRSHQAVRCGSGRPLAAASLRSGTSSLPTIRRPRIRTRDPRRSSPGFRRLRSRRPSARWCSTHPTPSLFRAKMPVSWVGGLRDRRPRDVARPHRSIARARRMSRLVT